MKKSKFFLLVVISAISLCGCSSAVKNNEVENIEQEKNNTVDLVKNLPEDDNKITDANKDISTEDYSSAEPDNDLPIEDNNSYVSSKDLYTPKLIDVKETDEYASEDKFDKFFEIKDVKEGDVTSFADGYEDSDLKGKLSIKRVADTEGYVEYHFSDSQKELFNVKNEIENLYINAEYIQFKDINGDGNDEILVSYYTQSTAFFLPLEFYVYGIVDDKWQQLMSYTCEDDERSISKLINSSPYRGRQVSDVYLSDDGLVILTDEGEKIDGVYYPHGYELLVR